MTARRRIVVTGAGGFVGQALLSAVPGDWEVVAVSRRTLADRPGVRAVQVVDPTEHLPPDLIDVTFDAIVHLAGNASHALADRAPWEDLEATGVLGAALLSRVAARRIVLLSSAAVYEGLSGETSPDRALEPSMPYALAKLYVEGLTRGRVRDGQVESATVLRLYNAFGPGERPTRLIPSVANAIRSGGEFVLSGDPASLSDPLPVAYVAAALIAAVSAPGGGTLDLCGGDPVPLADQVSRLARWLGKPDLRVRLAADPQQRPIRFWSNPRPAREALALDAPPPLEGAVRDYATLEGWLAAAAR